ncbi:transcription elongation factor spt5 [Savitreella phatthalungensis]
MSTSDSTAGSSSTPVLPKKEETVDEVDIPRPVQGADDVDEGLAASLAADTQAEDDEAEEEEDEDEDEDEDNDAPRAIPRPQEDEDEDELDDEIDEATPAKRKYADDDEDEDEDEEDDEEDEDAVTDRRRKKHRRGNVSAFIDAEAEVDDDDEDLDDEEEEQELNQDFIANDPEDVDGAANREDDRRHRELDQKRREIDSLNAQELAARYREQYGKSQTQYRGDTTVVPQRLLLPSVQDPSIWGMRCKIGKEQEIIFNLLRKQADLEYTDTPLEIVSAFQRDALVGWIYVEAWKQSHVQEAVKDVSNLYASKLHLVEVSEMASLLRVRESGTQLVPGSYVRVSKRNKRYAGDLAQIDDIHPDGLEARVKIVPRIDYSSSEAILKRNITTNERPPARFFNATDAERTSGQRVRGGDGIYEFNGDRYEDGYLIKDFKLEHLIQEDVKPTIDELKNFPTDSASFDLTGLQNGLRTNNFALGDTVEVTSGEQAGVVGKVKSISNNVATIETAEDGLGNLSVPVNGLRKQFAVGSHVRVQAGKHAGETGLVLSTERGNVTFMSDMTNTEVSVFARDLGEVSENSAMPVRAKYEVEELVALNASEFGCVIRLEGDLIRVLMGDGTGVRTVNSDAISMKLSQPRGRVAATTDRNGNEVRVGDKIRETDGENRKGTVIQIHLGKVFARDLALVKDNGIFVLRPNQIENLNSLAGARGINFSKMNPALGSAPAMAAPAAAPKTVGRDRAIGVTASVISGPHKGIAGLIKSSTDTHVKLELQSGTKTINVPKDKLGFRRQGGGAMMRYAEFVAQRSGGASFSSSSSSGGAAPMPRINDAARPAWARAAGTSAGGGATPAAGTYSGARTPAWGASGARTPAWGASGSRTPGWGASGGAKTPAWGGGAQTPAWNGAGMGSATPAWNGAGSATPAWNAGSKTPTWYNAGGRTPAYNAGGGRTPAYNAGGRTPAYNSGGGGGGGYGASYDAGQSAYGGGGRGGPNTDAYAPTDNYGARTPAHRPPGQTQASNGTDDWEGDIHPSRRAQAPALGGQTPAYAPPSP